VFTFLICRGAAGGAVPWAAWPVPWHDVGRPGLKNGPRKRTSIQDRIHASDQSRRRLRCQATMCWLERPLSEALPRCRRGRRRIQACAIKHRDSSRDRGLGRPRDSVLALALSSTRRTRRNDEHVAVRRRWKVAATARRRRGDGAARSCESHRRCRASLKGRDPRNRVAAFQA